MKNTVVIGAQWGDEGKAKITDLLAQKADLIIRYQGGCNAGHTVVANNGYTKLFYFINKYFSNPMNNRTNINTR